MFIGSLLLSIFRIDDRTVEIELPYRSSVNSKDKDLTLPGMSSRSAGDLEMPRPVPKSTQL